MAFANWQTPPQIKQIHLGLVVILIVLLNAISINAPDQAAYAQTYFALLVMVIVVLFLTKTDISKILSWGEDWNAAKRGFLIGGLLIFVMSLFKIHPFSIGVPLALGGGFAAFFLVGVAALAEEFTFRESLPVAFGNTSLSHIISQVAFGLYHTLAYSAYAASRGVPLETLVFGAILFGASAAAINIITRSTAAGLGMHMTNNLIVFTGLGV
jgi:membrane protease YdiL (CAAX protease family)